MSYGLGSSRERESRHLWVGGLPDDIDEAGIKEYFSRFGKIEGVKILPQKYPNIGVAAFIDFYDIKSAMEAKDTKHKLEGHELRTNFKANPSSSSKHEVVNKPLRHEERESDSSSSVSGTGSSSSSSTSDSEQDSKKKTRRKTSSGGAVFMKATGLANRPDRVLLDGLYYEFCRYSNSVAIRLYSDAEKKWAVVKYKRADKCKDALAQSQGMMLFGSKLKLAPMDVDEFPPGGLDLKQRGSHQSGGGMDPVPMSDDLDPLATRSLFVGNIPKHISVYELRDAFLRYGNVLDVEIKKMGGNATYGFILYYDLMSAVTAKQYMDGHDLKGNKLRVGFGKGTASKQLWIDGIDPTVTEAQMERSLGKYGRIIRLGIDRQRCCAMVQYDSMDSAKEALNSVKGTFIKNSAKLMTDFANRDARAAFFARVEGGEAGLPPPRVFPGPPGPLYGPDMDPRMMMPPRPGGMHMMGRGYPPPGAPMDYYYHPYMEGFFPGGRLPYGPPGMRGFPPGGPGRGFGREAGDDDYEEELRAYSRKREREKRKRQESSSNSSSSGSDKEDEEMEPRKRKKTGKGKDKVKKVPKKPKREPSDEGEAGSDSEDQHEEARLKATKKSRDLREKLKRLSRKNRNNTSSEEATSGEDVHERSNKAKAKAKQEGSVHRGEASPEQRIVHRAPSPPPSQEKAPKTSPSQGKVGASFPVQGKARVAAAPPEKHRPHKASSPSPDRRKALSQSDYGRVRKLSPKIRKPSPTVRKAFSSSPDRGKASAEVSKAPSPPSDVLEEACKNKGRDKNDYKHRERESSPNKVAEHNPARGKNAYSSPKQEEEERRAADSEEGSDLEQRRKRLEREKARKDQDEKMKKVALSKAKSSHKDISNGAMGKAQRSREDGEGLKAHRLRNSGSDLPAKEVDTPQSPIMSTKSSHSSNLANIESELSSGEDFKEGNTDWRGSRRKSAAENSGSRDKLASQKRERSKDRRSPHPPSRPRTPDYPIAEELEWKQEGMPHTPSPPDKPVLSDEEDINRRSRKLPRRYQVEPMSSEPGSSRRESGRYRDGKDGRQERRYNYPQPPSPSPPPPQPYSGPSRKRYHHSPPPAEGFDRRRARPYSPVGYQRRRYSRSPPYHNSPPPHRAKSPRRGSPPHSRPRSPLPRPRPPPRRGRHDSPPFEGHRGKYGRGHSPPSPHHRHPFSPSPPPRSGARSPLPGRRYGRRHSSSLTPPPRAGRGARRERSAERASPRLHDERHDSLKRHGKRAGFSRSPSPRDKYRDTGKEDYPEQKRRKPAPRPKSPSGTPPPPSREETKNDNSAKIVRQQAHPPEVVQPSSTEQRNPKQSSTPSTQLLSRQPAEASTKTTARAPTALQASPAAPPPENNLLDLLRRYPVMWQGLLMLKNDSAAVQLHFLSGNVQLAKSSLPLQQSDQTMPILRISQRMRLEKTQLEGVDRRIQTEGEHCLLLALPCGRDATDVHTQTHALKNNLINYLLQKQAAGIINIPPAQGGYVLHIFPPCPFSQSHLSHVAPDLLSNASVNCHLMIVVATM